MNTTTETGETPVDTSWRGMLADPEAVFVVGIFGATAVYGAFFWRTMPWLATSVRGSSAAATLRDVRDYLGAAGGNPLSRSYFAGGGLALALVVVLGILLTWVPLAGARYARIAAVAAAIAGVVGTVAALACAPGTGGDWLPAGVHAQAGWLAVGGFVLLGAAAAMARPAVRREL